MMANVHETSPIEEDEDESVDTSPLLSTNSDVLVGGCFTGEIAKLLY